MEYRLRQRKDCDRGWTVREGKKAEGYSLRAFRERYPKEAGGYQVIGAVGAGCRKETGEWLLGKEPEKYYELPGSHFLYKTAGYIEVGENVYLAVKKSRLAERIAELLLILAVIGGISAGIWYLFFGPEGPDIDPGAGKYTADVELPENIDPDRISLPGYDQIRMEAGTDTAYVALWNPDRNPCYFQFEFVLDETGEVIYESRLTPPGNAVTEVQFDRTFDRGLYPITIRINTFNLEDYEQPMNGGEIAAELVAVEQG